MWKNLCFVYILEPVKEVPAVKRVIGQELSTAIRTAPIAGLHEKLGFLFLLSESDFRFFYDGEQHIQLPSKASILVQCGMDYFKCPVREGEREWNAITLGSLKLPCVITIHLHLEVGF